MYFEKISAIAFGPLRDKVLELAPGLNVVFGLNEAGKSTWHAAIYAGLCGMRRGKGPLTSEDQAFRDRYRPWGENERGFQVTAHVALEDERNRRVELVQDLDSRVAHVPDAVLPDRDYADEIDHDGAPDGSRWLGLTRDNFLRTACIRQAEVRRVADKKEAEGLQVALQKAATAGSRFTARKAIDAIEDYRSTEIGSDRAPTKPLRVTRDRIDELTSRIEEARQDRERCDEHRQRLDEAKADLATARSALAGLRAADAESRLWKAEAMAREFPDGSPMPTAAAPEVEVRVGEAVSDFRKRPDPERHTEAQVHEIDRAIAADAQALAEHDTLLRQDEEARATCRRVLQETDSAHQKLTGELTGGAAELKQIDAETARLVARREENEKELTEQRASWEQARESLRQVEEQVKKHREERDQASAETAEVLDKQSEAKARASGLEAKAKAEEERLRSVRNQIDEFRATTPNPVERSGGGSGRWPGRSLALLVGSLAAALAGAGLTGLGTAMLGAALLVAGSAGLLAWALLARRAGAHPGSSEQRNRLQEQLTPLRKERTAIQARLARLESLRNESTDRLGQLERTLRARQGRERDLNGALPDLDAQRLKAEQKATRREVGTEALASRITEARDELAKLAGRRAETEALQHEREGGARRRKQDLQNRRERLKKAEETVAERRTRIAALKAERRERLKSRSAALKDLEDRKAADAKAANRAERVLRRIAQEVLGEKEADHGLSASGLLQALEDWRKRQKKARVEDQERLNAYADYREFVGPGGIDSLRREARDRRREADGLRNANAAPNGVRLPERVIDEGDEDLLKRNVSEIANEARTLEARLAADEERLPSLADLEDNLAAEKSRLDELESLDATLDKAVEHLREAEERVYYELAPKLQASLQEHLGRVTGGRYRACKIDPDTLALEVQTPHSGLRPARSLSLGTQEQIYLLLRFALAEHLTFPGQKCPLILDDVVAAADTERKRAILETLLILGDETQVLLFTHEDDVLGWARGALAGDRHRLIELEQP